jgi:hypothetical protein
MISLLMAREPAYLNQVAATSVDLTADPGNRLGSVAGIAAHDADRHGIASHGIAKHRTSTV